MIKAMSEKILEISKLSENLLDLMSDIQNQIEVTLTREGVPFAKITPLNIEKKFQKPDEIEVQWS